MLRRVPDIQWNFGLILSISSRSDTEQLCTMGDSKVKVLANKHTQKKQQNKWTNKNKLSLQAEVWYRYGGKHEVLKPDMLLLEKVTNIRQWGSYVSMRDWFGLVQFSGGAARKKGDISEKLDTKRKGNLVNCCFRSGTQWDFSVIHKSYRKITLHSTARILCWETGIQNCGTPKGWICPAKKVRYHRHRAQHTWWEQKADRLSLCYYHLHVPYR